MGFSFYLFNIVIVLFKQFLTCMGSDIHVIRVEGGVSEACECLARVKSQNRRWSMRRGEILLRLAFSGMLRRRGRFMVFILAYDNVRARATQVTWVVGNARAFLSLSGVDILLLLSKWLLVTRPFIQLYWVNHVHARVLWLYLFPALILFFFSS